MDGDWSFFFISIFFFLIRSKNSLVWWHGGWMYQYQIWYVWRISGNFWASKCWSWPNVVVDNQNAGIWFFYHLVSNYGIFNTGLQTNVGNVSHSSHEFFLCSFISWHIHDPFWTRIYQVSFKYYSSPSLNPAIYTMLQQVSRLQFHTNKVKHSEFV